MIEAVSLYILFFWGTYFLFYLIVKFTQIIPLERRMYRLEQIVADMQPEEPVTQQRKPHQVKTKYITTARQWKKEYIS